MIVASGANDSPAYLGAHLIKPENEQVVLLPSRGLLAEKVGQQLQEISLLSGGAPLWHVTFNPARQLTESEWASVLDIYEAEFGLSDVPRAGVEHAKPGEHGNRARHRHYIWASRDYTTGFKLNQWRSKIRDEKVGWLVEHDFRMPPTRRAHTKAVIQLLSDKRPDVARWLAATNFHNGSRPVADLNSVEREMKARTGDDPRDVRAALLAAWLEAGGTPARLVSALAERGVLLERGESEGRVLVRSGNGCVQEVGRALNQALKAAGLPRVKAAQISKIRAELHSLAKPAPITSRHLPNLPGLARRARRPANNGARIQMAHTDEAKSGFKAKRLADLYGVRVGDLPADIGDLIGFISGTTMKSRSGATIFDLGKTISATAPSGNGLRDDAIGMMVAIAKAKGWKSVTLDGSQEFRMAAARLLALEGIEVAATGRKVPDVDFHARKSAEHASGARGRALR